MSSHGDPTVPMLSISFRSRSSCNEIPRKFRIFIYINGLFIDLVLSDHSMNPCRIETFVLVSKMVIPAPDMAVGRSYGRVPRRVAQ
jgi:hypothetical protein